MSKKTIKAAKTASKTTKATADKVAHAKEMKRIRDAKYRAAKKAAAKAHAQVNKAVAQAKDEAKRRVLPQPEMLLAILGGAIIGQGMAMRALQTSDKLPQEARTMCKAAADFGACALLTVTGKEVR